MTNDLTSQPAGVPEHATNKGATTMTAIKKLTAIKKSEEQRPERVENAHRRFWAALEELTTDEQHVLLMTAVERVEGFEQYLDQWREADFYRWRSECEDLERAAQREAQGAAQLRDGDDLLD
jgi:hypothetical protein